MNKKRFIALFAATLMLLALFAGCSQDNEKKTDETKPETGDTAETGKTDTTAETENEDTTDEDEVKTIGWLGTEEYMWSLDYEDAKDFASRKDMDQKCLDNYNLNVEAEIVSSDAYLTTLNGYIASNTLPDSFYSQGIMKDNSLNQAVNQGKFAPLDDVLQYSDGTASTLFDEGGGLRYLKAWAMMEDGNWYYIKTANNTGGSIDMSTPTTTYRADCQIHGIYSMCIRQDWLDDLGLSTPTTTDEFYEYLSACQTQDANGNQTADERLMMGLGTDYQYQGIAQWFGLPYMNFIENPGTGVIELPCLMEGYTEFCQYVNNLYSEGLVLSENGTSGHIWAYSGDVAGNYCSAHCMMPKYIWLAATGDDNADYEPLPIITALDNVQARVLGQESVAGGYGITISADADYETAARFIDFLHSKDFYMTYEYGVEGKAWEYDSDGNFVRLSLSDDDVQYASPRANWMGGSYYPGVLDGNVWDPLVVSYDSCQAALDAGEPYTEDFTTFADWQELNQWDDISPAERMLKYVIDYGEDNVNLAAYCTYVTIANDEETQVIDTYENDLKTYLLEMTTNFIVGKTSLDDLDDEVQFAYDNLGLQEYMDMLQSRYNRYLDTMGFATVNVNE